MFFVEAISAVALLIGFNGPVVTPADGAPPPLLIGLVASSEDRADAVERGAEAALLRINSNGGVDGRPLRLVRLAAAEPWRDGAARIAELVFRNDLAALIGPTDGATAHVAAQIATRSRIPLLTLSPAGALTRVKDPWIFRGVPDDAEQVRALLTWANREHAPRSVWIAVPAGRAGRERLAAIEPVCDDLDVSVAAVIEAGSTDLSSLPPADLLLLWDDPLGALDLLQGLERIGRLPGRVLGSTRLDTTGFPRLIPRGIESFALPRLVVDGDDADTADLSSRLAYDMVQMIVAAARRYGTTPEALQFGLHEVGAVAGLSGEFGFDSSGSRVGDIPIGILLDGKLLPQTAGPMKRG